MVIVLQYIPYHAACWHSAANWHIGTLTNYYPPPENKSVAVSVDTRNK